MTASLLQCTTLVWNFIFFGQFQIGLPLEWIAIILRAWHRPGGCQPSQASDLPP
jgi:hypothetical protein